MQRLGGELGPYEGFFWIPNRAPNHNEPMISIFFGARRIVHTFGEDSGFNM